MVNASTLPLALLLAALVGVTLGVLGGGGSILTVPIFAYALGFDAKLAVAMSLPVVGAASLFGAAGHWRRGNVDLRLAVIFGAGTMAGAFAGARIGARLPGSVQLLLLAIVMLVAAVAMFHRAGGSDLAEAGLTASGGTVAPASARAHPAIAALASLGVGLLTGMLGVGGGFMIVPALTLLLAVPMRRAVGTSLLVIALGALAGTVGYLGLVTLPWDFMLLFLAAAAAGTAVGVRLGRVVPVHMLARSFALFLVVVGSFVLYRNRHVLAARTPAAGMPDTPAASSGSPVPGNRP